jgi:hypothetical protein
MTDKHTDKNTIPVESKRGRKPKQIYVDPSTVKYNPSESSLLEFQNMFTFLPPRETEKPSSSTSKDTTNRDLKLLQNKWCWWDLHPFESNCFQIIINNSECAESIQGMGTFCSVNCCLAYIYEQFPSSKMWKLVSNLYTYYGISSNVSCAPPRNYLIEMGGDLDIDTFRKIRNDSLHIVCEKPMDSYKTWLEEFNKKEGLVLSRKKPRINTTNQLPF